MEETLKLWISNQEQNIPGLSLKFLELEEHTFRFEILGHVIILLHGHDNSNVLAIHGEEKDLNVSMGDILINLNERLERLKTTDPDCLLKSLEFTLKEFLRQRKYEIDWRVSWLYKAVGNANSQCHEAMMGSDGHDNILAWCCVHADVKRRVVALEMDMRGVLYDSKKLASALGFPFEESSKLIIEFIFTPNEWNSQEELRVLKNLRFDAFVKRNMEHSFRDSVELDEKDEDVFKSLKRIKQYGVRVVVPELVKGFLDAHGNGIVKDENLFGSVFKYVAKGIRQLRNCCILCKTELPELSRMFFCDLELCLFNFEDFGIGGDVLQELQDTMLAEFQIATARDSCNSGRDVFEPYPTFLLRSAEVRKRSGFFSDRSDDRDHYKNKDLDLMSTIMSSFPQVAEMQKCETETDLMFKLYKSWITRHSRKNSGNEKVLLPYKLLKFILYTNRLSMSSIQSDMSLDVPRSCYQFAVMYDSHREESFQMRRKRQGSIFAFHGSSSSNWYSIIRNGLKCLSNTNYMSAGASLGQGIYFSKSFQYSALYSSQTNIRLSKEAGHLESSVAYNVIAICEILSGEKHVKTEKVVVVPGANENDIAIRYLILFDGLANSFIPTQKVESDTCIDHLFLGQTNLVEHYKLLREEFIERNNANNLAERQKCRELFEKQKAKAGTCKRNGKHAILGDGGKDKIFHNICVAHLD